jgi:hypothetical protein
VSVTREEASARLRNALERGRAARDLGLDVAQVRGLARQARSALAEGDYETSLRQSEEILALLSFSHPVPNRKPPDDINFPDELFGKKTKAIFVGSRNSAPVSGRSSNQSGEWGTAIALFVFLLMLGIALMIPTETRDYGFGVTVTYHPYAYIGWTLIGISWLILLWPFYKHIYTSMPKAYGQAIGEGISRGLRKGKVCPDCSTINDAEAKFCPECGFRWSVMGIRQGDRASH